MSTAERCEEFDVVCRKYRKGKAVESKDLWAVRRLSESDLIRMYVKDEKLYAIASFKSAK